MPNTDEHMDNRSPEQAVERSSSKQNDMPDRQIDPSESVTLFAIALGAIGGLVGLVAGITLLSNSGLGAAVLNCLIAILAGGSAGIVAGGTLGAAIGIRRGIRVPRQVGP